MPTDIVSVNEDEIRDYIGEQVRKAVEETPDALLDEEADQIANAGRYERTEVRRAYRSGHYDRRFQTTFGEVGLRVPKPEGASRRRSQRATSAGRSRSRRASWRRAWLA